MKVTNGYFQQDLSTAHTPRTTINYLTEFLPGRLIGAVLWPSRSPDLAPLDFFLFPSLLFMFVFQSIQWFYIFYVPLLRKYAYVYRQTMPIRMTNICIANVQKVPIFYSQLSFHQRRSIGEGRDSWWKYVCQSNFCNSLCWFSIMPQPLVDHSLPSPSFPAVSIIIYPAETLKRHISALLAWRHIKIHIANKIYCDVGAISYWKAALLSPERTPR